MTFNSPEFLLIFLPICLLGFSLVGRFGRRSAIGYLGFMSLVFYGAWNPIYLLLLAGSILFNYTVSRLIARNAGNERAQTGWLAFGIVSNLGCLCYFKYFFPLLHFLTAVGLTHRQWGSVILPLGISFFTFTQIAYLIDLKQGIAERESLLSYILFVTFFPHLIAGPLLHHKEMMPQFREERPYRLNRADMHLGFVWFGMGLFKKAVIADNVSPIADIVFNDPHRLGLWGSWVGALAYALQLYFDFSGYSDMAVGLARMFSIRFPYNFNSPYKAQSIIDFWQRWHMTLTRYVMDYLYAPIQFWISKRRLSRGKKVSKRAQATVEGFVQMLAFPSLLTMLIIGIWHGAGLQFIVFGLMHGSFITINYLWRLFFSERLRRIVDGPFAIAATFLCAMTAEVMFRAPNVRDALGVYSGMAGRHGLGERVSIISVVTLIVLYAVVWLMPNTQEILGQHEQIQDRANWSLVRANWWQPQLTWRMAALYGAILAFGLSMLPLAFRPFIYFQF